MHSAAASPGKVGGLGDDVTVDDVTVDDDTVDDVIERF